MFIGNVEKPTHWFHPGCARNIAIRSTMLLLVLMSPIFFSSGAYSQTWLPFQTRVCQGQTYTQITNTGQTRQQVGVKPQYCRCTAGFFPKRENICAGQFFTANCGNPAWAHYSQTDFGSSRGTVWTPNPNTVFVGTSFTQSSNCGFTRVAQGTKPRPDADNDGVPDSSDSCPATPAGQSVDAQGCSAIQLDTDLDGVANTLDQCPNTPASSTVNSDGCAPSQLDTDADGVSDELDQCPSTPTSTTVNGQGCAPSQLDSDNDGVNDAIDQCPSTPPSTAVDNLGCALPPDDFDGDGIPNDVDPYPYQGGGDQCYP